MIIGIVTTWFERGAAYVSKTYKYMLEKEGHTVYIFARGGENHESMKSKEWNSEFVTRSTKFWDFTIERNKFFRWVKNKHIECLFFNEQKDFRVLVWMRKHFPDVKLGAYIDYYTETTLEYYNLYDFLICNTKRHMQAMKSHPQKYFIEWGTDVDIYKPIQRVKRELTFFHSVGMSKRKGTDILVDTFIKHEIYKKSKLIIHTQIPINTVCGYSMKELEEYGITVVEKTVSPPGLYHLGDVYVYPTKLDGLGLTMYEALACGLPLITTNFPPMNEVGNSEIVKHIDVADFYCRSDAYYYPMCLCDSNSLAKQMNWFIDNSKEINIISEKARQFAIEHYDINKKSKQVSDAFVYSEKLPINNQLCKKIKVYYFSHFTIIGWVQRHRCIVGLQSKIRQLLNK